MDIDRLEGRFLESRIQRASQVERWRPSGQRGSARGERGRRAYGIDRRFECVTRASGCALETQGWDECMI